MVEIFKSENLRPYILVGVFCPGSLGRGILDIYVGRDISTGIVWSGHLGGIFGSFYILVGLIRSGYRDIWVGYSGRDIWVGIFGSEYLGLDI